VTALSIAFIAAVGIAMYFLRGETAGLGKAIETMSGVWSLVLYLSLGFVPALLRQWGSR
jgi:hypothetical protein